MVHICATDYIPLVLVVGASRGPALSEPEEQHQKRAVFLGAGLSPQEERTGYEGTQPENCPAAPRFVLILVRTDGAFV